VSGHEYRADIVYFLCARTLRLIATADADIPAVRTCTTGLGQSAPCAQFAHAFSRQAPRWPKLSDLFGVCGTDAAQRQLNRDVRGNLQKIASRIVIRLNSQVAVAQAD
jgi:hypothetical protein